MGQFLQEIGLVCLGQLVGRTGLVMVGVWLGVVTSPVVDFSVAAQHQSCHSAILCERGIIINFLTCFSELIRFSFFFFLQRM